LSAKDIPGGRTQILIVHRIRIINHHPVESDEDSTHQSISDSEDWLNQNGDLDNPNDSEDDCAADIQSDIEEDNSIEDSESPEKQHLSTIPYVPGLIQPTQQSKRHTEEVLVTVNASEMRSNMGVKTR
jgi:hypothetical protein